MTSKKNLSLVIVESPAKAKTIKKYLGPGYEVVASMGHIRDLPKKGAIDVQNNFATTYEVSTGKKKVVSGLKKLSKQSTKVILATDEDREGEAIARHICEELGLDVDTTERIVFHEITKEAIQGAVQKPRTVDQDLVNAQQARRVLDRLVGFDLSPVLRKKIKAGLSAGRVQSVSVRLLVERERKIQEFEPTISYKGEGIFSADKTSFKSQLHLPLGDKEQVESFISQFGASTFLVESVVKKAGKRSPGAPFTTSSLQQEASRKLGFSVSRTMQLAQRLYENGHITYMRTDSKSLSGQAHEQIASVVKKIYGDSYYHQRLHKSKSKGAQEAHEAIRPTNFSVKTAGLDESQKKLYDLIYRKTVASQMSDAKIDNTTCKITGSQIENNHFVAKGEILRFDGFMKVYKIGFEDKELPELVEGKSLIPQAFEAHEHHSKPPARFTEASLVKKLEDLGIGRPSTYAPTITTIQKRGYVDAGQFEGVSQSLSHCFYDMSSTTWKVKSKKTGATKGKLVPTDIGIVVTDFLKEHFDQIMDYQFTASVEAEFDKIAEGKIVWSDMLGEFYTPFKKKVSNVVETADRASGERELGTDPKSGKIVKVRIGRYGPLVQIGESDDENVKYSPIRGELHIETILLEQALDLFKLPRVLGELEGKELRANIGRFGPYVQHGSTFASLKDPDNVETVEYDRAVELIIEKKEKDKARLLFDGEHNKKIIQVIKGRWGPYIKYGRDKFKLPKDIDVTTLSLEVILPYIEQPGQKTKKKTSSKKATTTKKAKKKPPVKKKKK